MTPCLSQPFSTLVENWWWLAAILSPLSIGRVPPNWAWDDPFSLLEEQHIHTGPIEAPPAFPRLLYTEPQERSLRSRAPQALEKAVCSDQ